ncbi:MAG: Ig-like domain-containing protein [Bacteroidales bacterium]|nr:Ig-like domain-containing protein [Bacteroidales bacterium]
MKKNLFAYGILAMGVVLSCARAEQPEMVVEPELEVVFSAATEAPDSKTVIQDTYHVYWSPGDEISLFYGSGSGGGNRFTAQNSKPAAETEFVGSMSSGSSGQYFWGIYPYDASNACDGSSVTLNVPSDQIATSQSFAPGSFPSIARSQTKSLQFYNVCGGLCFTVSRRGITSVTFTASGNKAIAGKVKVKFGSDGKPSVVSVLDAKSEITLTAQDGSSFEPGVRYYLSMLPAELSSGFTMSFATDDGKTGTFSTSRKVVVKRSVFGNIPEADGNVSTWEGGAVHVTGISLDRSTATIKEGESVTLIPTVIPDNATNKTVSWSTSSETVASVDSNGKVTGIKAGSATITATTEDGGKKATCSLTVEANIAPSVTVGTEHVSAVSAVLKGKASFGTTVAADLQVGFQYSKSAGILPSNSTTVEATDADANYNYTAGITGLEPDSKYYFRSFILQNGQYTYGETKEFTTKTVSELLETLDATNIGATSASLNAKLDLTDVIHSSKSYGFYWGTSESSQNTKLNGGEIEDQTYSASLTNLSHKTQYWYKAYVTLDSQTFYGEVKTFTTDVVPVESVSLDKTEYTFHTIGNTLTLKATVLPAYATDKSVKWASNDESIVTVDQNGTVKAVGNGTATITVTTKDQGKTATCVITVAQHVTGISLSNMSLTLFEGQEQALTATVNPDNANDKSLTWTSSDESIAKVDENGKVTAVSKGTATIKVEANDGSGKYANCSVTVKRPVASIELNKTSLILYRGSRNVTETLTATVTPSTASNTSVSWSSSNSSVVTVSSSGIVTGIARGTATITVTANDGSGVKATCEVEVKQYVTSITLSKTSLSLVIGEEETISVTSILPDNANDKTYTWSSSDNTVAVVDQNGKITAKVKGNAVIKVTANDGSGVSASCAVAVKNPCPAGAVDLGLSVYWATCNLSESGFVSSPEQYGDYYAWGETEPKSNYDWSTYKWCNGSYNTLTRYCPSNQTYHWDGSGSPDNKTSFVDYNYADDAARKALGGKWRIPKDAEWTELREQCTWTWTTQNGVRGRLVKSKTNGNSIFLPAAGYRIGTNLYYAGSRGYYWSSYLNTDNPSNAWYVDFTSYGVYRSYDLSRYYGFSVRPVTD